MTTEIKPAATTKPRTSAIVGIVLILALAAFAAALCVNPGRANDLFWQLRTGQSIVSTHHAPHFDTYSWTRQGTPWVAHEWLSFAIFWVSYAWKGFTGVWLLTAALSIAIVVLLYALILKETTFASVDRSPAPITAALLTAFASLTAGAFFQPRPQLFTYLFMLVTLGVMMHVRHRIRGVGSTAEARAACRPMWVLVPLFLLWANLHAGVLIGLAILVVFVIVDAIAADVKKDNVHLPSGAMTVVVIACFAATLITPYGLREYQNFLATVSNTTVMNAVGEWGAPNFHDPFGKLFEGFVFLALIGVLATRLRHDPAELVLTGLFAHEALTGSRNVPIFAITSSVLLARHLQSTLVRALYRRQQTSPESALPADSLFGPAPSTVMVLAVGVAICFSGVMRISSTLKDYAPAAGSTVDRIALASIDFGAYPDRACAFIEREGIPRDIHMYNTYDDGGFLIWRMPERKVFVDSRADVYFGSMFDDVKKLTEGTLKWRDIMNAHGVDMIVAPATEAQSRYYLAAPDWALVYVDRADLDKAGSGYAQRNNTFIFLRRKPEYAGLISRCRKDCPVLASGRMQSYSTYLALK